VGGELLDGVLDPDVEKQRPLAGLAKADQPLLDRVVLLIGHVVVDDRLVDASEHVGREGVHPLLQRGLLGGGGGGGAGVGVEAVVMESSLLAVGDGRCHRRVITVTQPGYDCPSLLYSEARSAAPISPRPWPHPGPLQQQPGLLGRPRHPPAGLSDQGPAVGVRPGPRFGVNSASAATGGDISGRERPTCACAPPALVTHRTADSGGENCGERAYRGDHYCSRSRLELLRHPSISARRRPMSTQAGIVGTATMRGMMVLSAMRRLCAPLTRQAMVTP
jgi:hypothetical protein